MKKLLLSVFFTISIIIFLTACGSSEIDVEYKVVEEDKQGNGLYVRVTTEVTDEDSLRTIADEIKKEKKSNEIDAVWLWIHDTSDDPLGKLLAKIRIPYNQKGQMMVGAEDSNYIFELK